MENQCKKDRELETSYKSKEISYIPPAPTHPHSRSEVRGPRSEVQSQRSGVRANVSGPPEGLQLPVLIKKNESDCVLCAQLKQGNISEHIAILIDPTIKIVPAPRRFLTRRKRYDSNTYAHGANGTSSGSFALSLTTMSVILTMAP